MASDYYKILGVPKNASESEIKSAYRKLALKYHPDRNQGNKDAEAKFKEVNGAYQVLSDPQKRQMYDQYGEAGVSGAAGGGPGGFQGFGGAGPDVGDIFGDIFENFFGGGVDLGGRGRARRGADLKYEATIDLEEAYRGTEVTVEYGRLEACGTCDGTGARPGSGMKRCAQCRGTGRMQFSQGFFTMSQACTRCGGAGSVIETPCRDCGGAGRVRRQTRRTVKIPPGVGDGSTLRVQGAGEAGPPRTPHGDLYVQLHVRHHPHFERAGDDLHYQRRITFPEAALGCSIEVPTLEGVRATIKVPPGTQDGTTLRLRDKGMPRLQARGHGDLLVKVKVEVPTGLTARQRALLEEFAKTLENGDEHPHPKPKKDDGGIFNKIFGSE